MMIDIWKSVGIIALAGVAGGLGNSLAGGALPLPVVAEVEGVTVLIPGFVGNMLIGALAATISFGM